MENSVKVAICIPYYKKAENIKRLLHTVKKQTFSNYIVIITDDSADSDIEEFVSYFDDRIIYYKNITRLGSTKNCNYAISLAQKYHPQYIKVMHHDDYFSDKNSLQEYVDMLDFHPEAILAFSGASIDINMGQEIRENGATRKQIDSLRENKYSIVEGNFIGGPSAVIVRNVGIKMDENLVWLVDVDWYLKLLEYENHFVHTEKQLIMCGWDGNRVTDMCINNMDLVQKEWLYIYLKHSPMQDFFYLDQIIRQCIIYYRKEKGYWHEEDYLAILFDAIRDRKKICLWGVGEFGIQAYRRLKDQGISVDCFLDGYAENWGRTVVDYVMCMSFEEFEKQKKEYFCIVALHKAKDIRKMLAEKGINSLPYIEKFFDKKYIISNALKKDVMSNR